MHVIDAALRLLKTPESLERFFHLEAKKYGESLRTGVKDDVDDLRYVDEEDFLYLKFFSIHVNKTMVGYAAFQEESRDCLERLYISPVFRRMGIAGAVLSTLGISQVTISADNLPAVRLCEKHGFKGTPSCQMTHTVKFRREA